MDTMNTIFPFLLNHWVLSIAFIAVLAALFLTTYSNTAQGVNLVTAASLVSLMNGEKTVILDNRPKEAFDSGHILGAKPVPNEEDETKAAMVLIDKHKTLPVVVVGQTEANGLRLASDLVKQGVKPVFCLRGGMGAWREANLPLSQKS
ncbi:MAG: Rhodanese domain protein [Gammaproteobacteria bacterium]|jgi:rhodanese-related sulfurtransferase|nr:Rhodanese domain protein [Gammaproteobacteria bacterium]